MKTVVVIRTVGYVQPFVVIHIVVASKSLTMTRYARSYAR
jgi:hypothetical protein